MNTEILQKLTTERLMELKKAVEAEMLNRFDYQMLPGREANFTSSADGILRTVVIERINIKTVSVREVGTSHNPGSRWKVSKTALKMIGVPIERVVRPTANPSPSTAETYGVDTW